MQRFGRPAAVVGICGSLAACAYVSVQDTAINPRADGFRVYGAKTLVYVSGADMKKLIVPDCTREFAVKPGSVFAKHKFSMKLTDGMITEVDSDQDSTAIPLELVKIVKPLIGGGDKGLSGQDTRSAVADQFAVYDARCENGKLTFVPLDRSAVAQLKITSTSAPVATPTPTGGPTPGPEGVAVKKE